MNPQKSNSLIYRLIHAALCLAAALALVSLLSAQRAMAREIIVVQSIDLSGRSNLGKDFSNGIRTYFDAVNERGGVRGRRLNFLQLDDGGDPKQTLANLRQMLRENEVDIIIAPTSAESYIAASNEVAVRSRGLVLVGAPTGAQSANLDRSRVLSLRATYADESRQLLNHIGVMQIKRIALIRGESDEAAFAADAFRAELKRRNIAPVFDGDSAQWNARNAQNAAIEAVVIAGDAIAVAQPLAHARKTATAASLFGFSMIDHRTLLELSKDNAIGMVISQAMPSADKSVYPFQREHRAMMKRFRDEPPSLHTLEGYVVARTLISAIELIDGEPTAGRVAQALRQMRDIDLGPLVVSTRSAENAVRFVNLSAVSRRGELID
jgi:branched-chain amino acid transport system substrate-binding protein